MKEDRPTAKTEAMKRGPNKNGQYSPASTSPASPTTTRAACTAPGSTPPRTRRSWSAPSRRCSRARPHPAAEEWAIHDYEGFGALRLDEFESLAAVAKIARGIAEHGPAFAAWAAHVGTDSEALDDFEEAYMGEWESEAAFAEEMLNDMGQLEEIMRAVPEHLAPYVQIDYEGFVRRPRVQRRARYSGEARWRPLRLPKLVRILVVKLSTNDASAHHLW